MHDDLAYSENAYVTTLCFFWLEYLLGPVDFVPGLGRDSLILEESKLITPSALCT